MSLAGVVSCSEGAVTSDSIVAAATLDSLLRNTPGLAEVNVHASNHEPRVAGQSVDGEEHWQDKECDETEGMCCTHDCYPVIEVSGGAVVSAMWPSLRS